MNAALPLRIFLASPGDLEDERSAVRSCVDEHNARQIGMGGVTYEVVEWDRIRGTARRAQDAINDLITESHFMVVLFKHDWGSAPGSPWGYTSGTEEELFTGLLELGQAEQPMRDLSVCFVADPAPDNRIVNLRKEIIDRHSLMFESITDERDLTQKLTGRLRTWEELASTKTPIQVDLLPSSGMDVLRAANLRLRGEKLIALGQTDAGRAKLHEAAALGGPVERLAYARFLRRSGELDSAYVQTQKAIDYFSEGAPLYSMLAADAFSAQARVLSAQGATYEAIGRLEHALTLAVGNDVPVRLARCRINDDIGLAYRRVGNLIAARRHFEDGLRVRREVGRDQEICQSLINLARLEMATGNLATAAEYAQHVINVLRVTPPSGVRANAEVLMAQVHLCQGHAHKGIANAEWALAMNRQIANRQGEAISLLMLARCCHAANRHDDAIAHAEACKALNKSIENVHGIAESQTFLDQLLN